MQNNTTKNIRITARALLLNHARTHILLVRHSGAEHLATPGGGIEEVDTHMLDCLKRELKEELGTEVIIERLAFSREFVTQERTVIEFYFLASLPTSTVLDLNYADEAHTDGIGGVEKRVWMPIKDIESTHVFPTNTKDIQKIIDDVLPYRHVITVLSENKEENIFI